MPASDIEDPLCFVESSGSGRDILMGSYLSAKGLRLQASPTAKGASAGHIQSCRNIPLQCTGSGVQYHLTVAVLALKQFPKLILNVKQGTRTNVEDSARPQHKKPFEQESNFGIAVDASVRRSDPIAALLLPSAIWLSERNIRVLGLDLNIVWACGRES